MEYWKSYRDKNGVTYSIDNIRIKLDFSEQEVDALLAYIDSLGRDDIFYGKPCFSPFKYKYLFTFNYSVSSMTLGVGLNGLSREDNFKGFLEFNPNKVFNDEIWEKDLRRILMACPVYNLARFDLAIDLPVARENLQIIKDKRSYTLLQNSSCDKSEYLGKRSTPGYVKLYNKTVESALDYDLSRLEITLDDLNHLSDGLKKWVPDVYYMDTQQTFLPEELTQDTNCKLSNTQRLLAKLIYQSGAPDAYLKEIDNYATRNKIKNYIFANCRKLAVDFNCVNKLVYDLRRLLPRL